MKPLVTFAAVFLCMMVLSSAPVRGYPCDKKEYSTFQVWVALWMKTGEGDYEREDFITDEIFPHYFEAMELGDAGNYEAACDILVKLIQDYDIPLHH